MLHILEKTGAIRQHNRRDGVWLLSSLHTFTTCVRVAEKQQQSCDEGLELPAEGNDQIAPVLNKTCVPSY